MSAQMCAVCWCKIQNVEIKFYTWPLNNSHANRSHIAIVPVLICIRCFPAISNCNSTSCFLRLQINIIQICRLHFCPCFNLDSITPNWKDSPPNKYIYMPMELSQSTCSLFYFWESK